MERLDSKRWSEVSEGDLELGVVSLEETHVQLSGTLAEATLIVNALETYVAVEKILRTLGVEFPRGVEVPGLPGNPWSDSIAFANRLIAEISQPNYVEDTVDQA